MPEVIAQVTTSKVDPEIATVPAPQLVHLASILRQQCLSRGCVFAQTNTILWADVEPVAGCSTAWSAPGGHCPTASFPWVYLCPQPEFLLALGH